MICIIFSVSSEGFREQERVVAEDVIPGLLHVVLVDDDTMLDGVLESQNTTFPLRLITAKGAIRCLQPLMHLVAHTTCRSPLGQFNCDALATGTIDDQAAESVRRKVLLI